MSLNSASQRFVLSEELEEKVKKTLSAWNDQNVIERVWKKDPTVWKEKKEEDKELSNRLGWLNLPEEVSARINELQAFSDKIRKEFDHVVLLGMGGSSLVPEVFFKTFGKKEGYPDLTVVDSTHPAIVKSILDNYNLQKTIFIVASKSGGTAETMSFYYIFKDAVSKITSNPGNHFIAITDSGSGLEKIVIENKFNIIFNTPEEVGGRYSVFTYFGLLPAALIGVDLNKLLTRAAEMQKECSANIQSDKNTGAVLGAVLGEAALAGNDKLTIAASPSVSAFPVWVEQLIAESTGKEGKGILPVVDEKTASPEFYLNDRCFVYLRVEGDENSELDSKLKKIENAGHNVIYISLNDIYDLGHEFYRWEAATALSGAVLKINPFDQPNVQLAKTLANEGIENYLKTGRLPSSDPSFSNDIMQVYGKISGKNISEILHYFFNKSGEGNYAAILAFLPYSIETDQMLDHLKLKIRQKYKIAVTSGYGPRFLHSTGQLHKGDGNKGFFIQLTGKINEDINVPGKGYSLGTLISAQAAGDFKALENSGRKVIRFHFNDGITEGIKSLAEEI